jgi:hypothetical protein
MKLTASFSRSVSPARVKFRKTLRWHFAGPTRYFHQLPPDPYKGVSKGRVDVPLPEGSARQKGTSGSVRRLTSASPGRQLDNSGQTLAF